MSSLWLGAVPGTTARLAAGDRRSAHEQEEIVVLEEGVAVVHALDEGQREAFTQVRRAPSVLGLERLAGAAQSYELYAVSDVTLRVVATADVRELIDQAPPPQRSLIRCCIGSLAATVDDRMAMSGNAVVRTARLLLVGGDGGVRFSRVARHHWAEALGMRPETLSRALKSLHERGWIGLRGDRVELLRPKMLEKMVTDTDR